MLAETITLEYLLEPISMAAPAGVDLRFSSEWKTLETARRSDDALNQGAWQTEDRKTANWSQVLALSSTLLKDRSKDLRLGMFLVEATFRTEGFTGLAVAIRFVGELLGKYWNSGLYPLPLVLPNGEESFADRAKALSWLNDKLADLVWSMPITFVSAPAPNYSYAGYLAARSVGREKDFKHAAHEQREVFEAAKSEGRCLDLYESAVKGSSLAAYEELSKALQETVSELTILGKVITDKFGDTEDAPGFSQARSALTEIQLLVEPALREKSPKQTGSAPVPLEAAPSAFTPVALPDMHHADAFSNEKASAAAHLGPSCGASLGASWEEAQAMVSSGQVDRGLARMSQLAQRETSGRNRFQRKLLLAEVCLKTRPRLARTILEELAEQIDKYKLEEWETTDVVGGVWTRLYRIYVESDESQKAAILYGRLCRLDPWQTMSCSQD